MQIGVWQLLLIVVLVFIVFGAGKLPRVMGDVGKGIRNLRKGLQGEDDNGSSSEITAQDAPEKLGSPSVSAEKTAEKKDNAGVK